MGVQYPSVFSKALSIRPCIALNGEAGLSEMGFSETIAAPNITS
jgi:hypothetical protein